MGLDCRRFCVGIYYWDCCNGHIWCNDNYRVLYHIFYVCYVLPDDVPDDSDGIYDHKWIF